MSGKNRKGRTMIRNRRIITLLIACCCLLLMGAKSCGGGAGGSLGQCIRNGEESGSYAWGPGNGGGAYQFQLATWETYHGKPSLYGNASPAYQDKIFMRVVKAGPAAVCSAWAADGCPQKYGDC